MTADGLTNVVVYNHCTVTWRFSPRAAFRALSITSVGISAPMMTIIHSYTKADKSHRFPKDEVFSLVKSHPLESSAIKHNPCAQRKRSYEQRIYGWAHC